MRKTKITGAKRRAAGLAAALFLTALLASGCQGGKEKYAFRETGISQMDAGDYEGAIQSFEQALEHSDGFVGEFELDVLKYRAEAEYALVDYAASAYTYDILVQADGERPEYLNRSCVMHALAGDTEAALACYEKAFAQAPEEEETKDALMALGDALEAEERGEEALALYEQALAGGMESGALYSRIALCRMDAGDYEGALAYLEQGLAAGDAQARAELLYSQAVVYEHMLDFSSALRALETYETEFGATPEIRKEIAFLKTR